MHFSVKLAFPTIIKEKKTLKVNKQKITMMKQFIQHSEEENKATKQKKTS